MDKKWNPTIDQVNGPINRTWDFISDEATELMEELQCPPEFLSHVILLRSKCHTAAAEGAKLSTIQ